MSELPFVFGYMYVPRAFPAPRLRPTARVLLPFMRTAFIVWPVCVPGPTWLPSTMPLAYQAHRTKRSPGVWAR